MRRTLQRTVLWAMIPALATLVGGTDVLLAESNSRQQARQQRQSSNQRQQASRQSQTRTQQSRVSNQRQVISRQQNQPARPQITRRESQQRAGLQPRPPGRYERNRPQPTETSQPRILHNRTPDRVPRATPPTRNTDGPRILRGRQDQQDVKDKVDRDQRSVRNLMPRQAPPAEPQLTNRPNPDRRVTITSQDRGSGPSDRKPILGNDTDSPRFNRARPAERGESDARNRRAPQIHHNIQVHDPRDQPRPVARPSIERKPAVTITDRPVRAVSNETARDWQSQAEYNQKKEYQQKRTFWRNHREKIADEIANVQNAKLIAQTQYSSNGKHNSYGYNHYGSGHKSYSGKYNSYPYKHGGYYNKYGGYPYKHKSYYDCYYTPIHIAGSLRIDDFNFRILFGSKYYRDYCAYRSYGHYRSCGCGGSFVRVWIEPVYETCYDAFNKPYSVLISDGYWATRWQPYYCNAHTNVSIVIRN